MLCSQCHAPNREGRRFCANCSAPLAIACPSCGFSNEPGEMFCGGCAARLTLGGPPRKVISPESPTSPQLGKGTLTAERRHLTVMFCDLVGSTALSERVDPEELHEVVRTYQEVCAEVINRLEGHIAQYLGDGMLVYFGYPVAREDDAQRAVRAALGIVDAVLNLHARFQRDRSINLAVRLGIHTGVVVVGRVGGGGKHEQLALGETPNLAARLQGLAKPNTVVISAATLRLVQGLFVCHDLGFQTLRGVASPVQVHHVLGESATQSRFEVAVATGLTALVGREEEVGLLIERWERAKDGMGQVVLLSGEAGIGKSRLVQVVKERLASELYSRVECRGSPYYQNSALHPVIQHLQRLLRLQGNEAPQEKLNRLERLLGQYGFLISAFVPLFASSLSLPLPERYPTLTLTPHQQKQKTLEAVVVWLLKEAEQRPVLLIVEDLHWVDPSTLDLLSLLLDQTPTARILILLTFRPDFTPPWAIRSHMTQITLSRLARRQVEIMVERVTGGKVLPAQVLQQVVAKTDGIPLFVEELTKTVLEAGWLSEQGDHYVLTGSFPTLSIPATLQDSLMARLDRLGAVKEVAQLCATLGREFSYERLQAVSPLEKGNLDAGLAQLVQTELLFQRGLPPQATYVFKHALIQEAAYHSLLKSKRQQYHQRIAQVLEKKFPETGETQPELLAHHYTEAGLRAEAIVYWQKAGRRAVQRSADREAISHLAKGLELLKTLPETPERIQQEIRLQITLGFSLMTTKGYAAPEVEQAHARAWELCQRVGETPRLFTVLMGLLGFYLVRAQHATARELGERLLTLAQSAHDPMRVIEAHYTLETTLLFLGELALAREHFERGIALYESQQYRPAGRVGQDPMVACLSQAGLLLWMLGYPDQALRRSEEAVTLARELSHTFNLAFALSSRTMLHLYRREGQATRTQAEAAISLCTEQGFAHYLAWGTIMRGWALAALGRMVEGIALMRQGLAASQAVGAELLLPYWLALLAESYGKVGQVGEGLAVLAEALATAHKNGERLYEAELHRLKGELLLALSPENHAEAEACFHQALDVARRQQAKSLELRAAMSVSRLLRKQGQRDESRQILTETYGWFTEGFATADLMEAKVLLDQVSGVPIRPGQR
jgi:predicted ATPase/class 3 adenylate cyclase